MRSCFLINNFMLFIDIFQQCVINSCGSIQIRLFLFLNIVTSLLFYFISNKQIISIKPLISQFVYKGVQEYPDALLVRYLGQRDIQERFDRLTETHLCRNYLALISLVFFNFLDSASVLPRT